MSDLTPEEKYRGCFDTPGLREKIAGEQAKLGRPSGYTAEIGELICTRMVCGDNGYPESLRSICREEGMPDLKTVMRWVQNNQEFRQQYALAREAQQELHHEDIKEIADNCTDDIRLLLGNDDGNLAQINHSAIARAKLQIETRKWIMGKMLPKKYGESTQLRHADADGNKLSFQGILNDIDGATANLPQKSAGAE